MSDHPSAPTAFHQANDVLLRSLLRVNGNLCLVAGLAMVLAAGPLAAWISPHATGVFDLSTVTLVRLAGLDVAGFAMLCWWTAKQRPLSRSLALLTIAMEALWVAGAAALLIAFPESLSTFGFWFVVATAVLALDFGLLQAFGLWQLYQGRAAITLRREGRDTHIHVAGLVDAPAEVVWQVMADQEGYADVADNIGKVEVLEGSGLGMVRQCSDTAGRSWRERCTFWEEGSAFAFVVDTEAPDYPYPLEYLQGRWSMVPAGELVSVEMDFVVRPRPGLMNGVLFRMLLAVLLPVCDRLLANWATRMQGETVTAWSRPGLRKSA